MTELLGIARFTFHEGKAGEFKRLSSRCMEIVRTQDTGTLEYGVYLDDDETEAIVIERYTDAAAAKQHMDHLGEDLFTEILATGSVQGETLGESSPELRKQMEGSGVRLFTPFLRM